LGADLGRADLRMADLSGANLRWANLSEADLGRPWDSSALRTHSAEIQLRGGVALIGSEAVPSDGLSIVLRHAAAQSVHRAEIGLPASVALIGGEAVPFDGLSIVLRYPSALVVHEAKLRLRSGIALSCKRANECVRRPPRLRADRPCQNLQEAQPLLRTWRRSLR
jgi:Pentapeptide repeats (8 copies)